MTTMPRRAPSFEWPVSHSVFRQPLLLLLLLLVVVVVVVVMMLMMMLQHKPFVVVLFLFGNEGHGSSDKRRHGLSFG